MNVQNQEKIVWPQKMVVAKAYVDQLERSQALSADQIGALRDAIQNAENKKKAGDLKKLAAPIEKSAGSAKSAADAARMQALADILKRPTI